MAQRHAYSQPIEAYSLAPHNRNIWPSPTPTANQYKHMAQRRIIETYGHTIAGRRRRRHAWPILLSFNWQCTHYCFGFPNSCKKTVADTWTSDPTLYEAPCNARSIGTTLIVSGPLHLRSSGTGHALGRSSAFSAESFFQMVMQKSDSLRTKAVGVPHPP